MPTPSEAKPMKPMHTPGPWEADFVRVGKSPVMGFGIWPVGRRAADPNTKGPQDVLSAITSANLYENWAFTGSYDAETIEANARLIAAAPDLLAACKAWVDGHGGAEAMALTRAAILRAEGR